MSGHIVLGVDLGTLGMKVIAVDAMTATVVGTASAPVENLSPATGYLEQVPERWWDDALPADAATAGQSRHRRGVNQRHRAFRAHALDCAAARGWVGRA